MTKFITIAAVISSMFLAACSDKPVPFSSAVLKDGKYTVEGVPFTGVLSGIASSTLYSTTPASIVIENNLALDKSMEGGLGKSTCSTKIVKGEPTNVYRCVMPSGVNFDIASLNGEMVETIRGYKDGESNKMVFQASVLGPVLHGEFVVDFVDTGKPAYMGSWKNGERVVETLFSQKTGKEIFKAMYRHNAYEGVVQKFADDGETVLFEANYVKGQPEGEVTEFDAEHQVLNKSVFAGGQKIHTQQWVKGSDGQPRMQKEVKYNLAGDVIYEHTAPIDMAPMKSPEQYRAEDRAQHASAETTQSFDKGNCFKSWKEHHFATRGDVPVTQQLVDRWVQACGVGKMPG